MRKRLILMGERQEAVWKQEEEDSKREYMLSDNRIVVSFDGIECKALIDTGANINCITERVFLQLSAKTWAKYEPCVNSHCQVANGQLIEMMRYVFVEMILM